MRMCILLFDWLINKYNNKFLLLFSNLLILIFCALYCIVWLFVVKTKTIIGNGNGGEIWCVSVLLVLFCSLFWFSFPHYLFLCVINFCAIHLWNLSEQWRRSARVKDVFIIIISSSSRRVLELLFVSLSTSSHSKLAYKLYYSNQIFKFINLTPMDFVLKTISRI